MLIRRLTLTAFAIFAMATSSLAVIANAAQHATPALADERDYGYYRQRHDRDDRRPAADESRRSEYDGRYGNDGTWYGRGYRGDEGRGYGDDRRYRDLDRDRERDDNRDRDHYDPHG